MTSLIITTVKLSRGFLWFPSSISSRQAPVSLKSCSPSSPVSHTGQKTPREHSVVPNRGIFLIQFLRVKIMLPLLLEKRFMVHLNFNVKILLFERRKKNDIKLLKSIKESRSENRQRWVGPDRSTYSSIWASQGHTPTRESKGESGRRPNRWAFLA